MASAALSSSFLAARPRVIGVAKSGRRPAVRGPVRVAAAGSTIASVSLNDNVDFYQVRALIRPWRLEKVVAELNAYGITGGKKLPCFFHTKCFSRCCSRTD